jgi:hypothetical protein
VIFGETSAISGENVSTWFGLMEDNIIKEYKDQDNNPEDDLESTGTQIDQTNAVVVKDPKKSKCKC